LSLSNKLGASGADADAAGLCAPPPLPAPLAGSTSTPSPQAPIRGIIVFLLPPQYIIRLLVIK
jgi:hypothetical protein